MDARFDQVAARFERLEADFDGRFAGLRVELHRQLSQYLVVTVSLQVAILAVVVALLTTGVAR